MQLVGQDLSIYLDLKDRNALWNITILRLLEVQKVTEKALIGKC